LRGVALKLRYVLVTHAGFFMTFGFYNKPIADSALDPHPDARLIVEALGVVEHLAGRTAV
jgi:hypothetical protein